MTGFNFNRSLELVLQHEGGYVNHPDDPGGPTNLGVTLANFRRYVKPGGTIADLKKLTKAQAGTVYRRQYWDRVHGNEMPGGLDYAMFDFGVNSGPSRAIKFIQEIVGARVDGRLGPQTMGAIQLSSAGPLATALCDKRLAWLKGLRRWPTFGKGWERRVKAVKADALSMADMVATSKPSKTPENGAVEPAIEAAPQSALGRLFAAILTLLKNWRRK